MAGTSFPSAPAANGTGAMTPLNMANALAHDEWSAATTENPADPIAHAVIAAKLFQTRRRRATATAGAAST